MGTKVCGERGAVVLWAAMLLGLVAVAGGLLAREGATATRRARGQAVADLVALAAVEGDRPAADRVAAANGARVLDLDRAPDGIVTARVVLDGADATASAVMSPDDP